MSLPSDLPVSLPTWVNLFSVLQMVDQPLWLLNYLTPHIPVYPSTRLPSYYYLLPLYRPLRGIEERNLSTTQL